MFEAGESSSVFTFLTREHPDSVECVARLHRQVDVPRGGGPGGCFLRSVRGPPGPQGGWVSRDRRRIACLCRDASRDGSLGE